MKREMRHNLKREEDKPEPAELVSADCLRHGENIEYMAALVEGLFAVQAGMRHNHMRHNQNSRSKSKTPLRSAQ